jgi:hypothetical protein
MAIAGAVVVGLLIVLATGGFGASNPAPTAGKRGSPPSPAARTAPFGKQLSALQRIIENAGR